MSVRRAIRTTIKPDINACPAELVYGEGLTVPGMVLPVQPPTDDELRHERNNTLDHLRLEVARLLPTPTSAHRTPKVHIPENLRDATHVWVRRNPFSFGFRAPYIGPFRVISFEGEYARIALPGRGTESVALERLKPAVIADDDINDVADPPQPPCPPPAPPCPPSPPPPATRLPSSLD